MSRRKPAREKFFKITLICQHALVVNKCKVFWTEELIKYFLFRGPVAAGPFCRRLVPFIISISALSCRLKRGNSLYMGLFIEGAVNSQPEMINKIGARCTQGKVDELHVRKRLLLCSEYFVIYFIYVMSSLYSHILWISM